MSAMSAQRYSQEKNLRQSLGELAFRLRNKTAGGHFVYEHEEAGIIMVSSDVRAAVNDARKALRNLDLIGPQFITWLRQKYDVPVDGQADVKLSITEEASAFYFDRGSRSPISTIQSFVAKKGKSFGLVKIDNKQPATWRITGPLYEVELSDPFEGEKPLQLVHRFNDTTKMALVRANIMTVPQLESLSLEELEAIHGMGRTRIREVWDFFSRGDPYEPDLSQIEASSLPRKTKEILKAYRITTIDQLKQVSGRDLVEMRDMSHERAQQIWDFFGRKGDVTDEAAQVAFEEPFFVAEPEDVPKEEVESILVVPPRHYDDDSETPDATAAILEQLRGALAKDVTNELENEKARSEIALGALLAAQRHTQSAMQVLTEAIDLLQLEE